MKFPLWANALWLVSFIEHVALVLILLLRRRLKGFPSVVVLALSRSVDTAVLFLITRYGTKHMYFVAYWVDEFSGEPIMIWMIVDICRDVLRPLLMFGGRIPRLVWIFVGMVVLTSAAYCGGLVPPGLKGFDLWQGREDVFTSMVSISLLVGVSLYAMFNGLGSRPHVTAVTYGLLTISYSGLIAACVHTVYGWDRSKFLFDYGCKLLYVVVIGYWCVIFWSSEKPSPPLPPQAIAFMRALHKQILADLDKVENPTAENRFDRGSRSNDLDC